MPYNSIFKPDLFSSQTIMVTGGGSGIGRNWYRWAQMWSFWDATSLMKDSTVSRCPKY
jgi:hypothetical protein